MKSILVRCLLFLPVLFFSSCQNNDEEIVVNNVAYLTKSSKLTELMEKTAINNTIYNSKQTIKKSSTTSTIYCTGLKYPVTFEVSYGDNPTLQQIVVNSDEELLEFFTVTLKENHRYYVFFPVTLLDAEGIETTVNSVEELEGSLQMAIEVCGDPDDDSDDDDSNDDDSNDDDSNDDDSDDDDSDDDNSDDDDSDDDDSDDDNSDDDDSDDDDSDDDDKDNIYDYCDSKMKKVYICHKGKTICVSVNAIWGHLNQHEEDFLGKCE